MIPVPTHRLLSLPGKKFIKKLCVVPATNGNRKLVDMSYNVLKKKKLKYVKNETSRKKSTANATYIFIRTCTQEHNIFLYFGCNIRHVVYILTSDQLFVYNVSYL